MAGKLICWFVTLIAVLSFACVLVGTAGTPATSAHGAGFFGSLVVLGVRDRTSLSGCAAREKAFLHEAQLRYEAFLTKVGAVDYKDYSRGNGNRHQQREEGDLSPAGRREPNLSLLRGSAVEMERRNSRASHRHRVAVRFTRRGRGPKIFECRSRAKENTGVFIDVKDIDHPVWHVRFTDKQKIDRWQREILNQSPRRRLVAARRYPAR